MSAFVAGERDRATRWKRTCPDLPGAARADADYFTGRGVIEGLTEIVALELLYSARSLDDYDARREDLLSLPWLHLTQAVAARALTIQHELAGRGQHRRPIPDLLVAATALEHDAVVLHYDRDFDLIAEVTGLSARWIIPAGTGHGGAA